jgi:hypothetical protein
LSVSTVLVAVVVVDDGVLVAAEDEESTAAELAELEVLAALEELLLEDPPQADTAPAMSAALTAQVMIRFRMDLSVT